MEKSNKVIFVIPVYNEEEIIEKVVDDIINEIKEIDFKVLLINDGSSDNSLEKIKKIKKKYNQKIEYIDQENIGHGPTLLKGYSYAVENYFDYIFQIDSDIVSQVERIAKEKSSKDNLLIITPSLEDLFKANIFALKKNGQQYYVPLWHDEVYFEDKTQNNDLIVKCIPDIPEHISIDENNNLHINVIHRTNLRDLLEKEHISYVCYDKSEKELISLNIPINTLFIRRHQTIKFFKMGIPKINLKDIYSINRKSDIIVHLELEY